MCPDGRMVEIYREGFLAICVATNWLIGREAKSNSTKVGIVKQKRGLYVSSTPIPHSTFCEMVSRQEQTDDDDIIIAAIAERRPHIAIGLKKRATLIYEASSFLYLLN